MSLNDFDIIKTLGKGAFSVVYKVVRKADKKKYALKKVTLENLDDKENNHALNEVRSLASLRSTNIIQYKEVFLSDD